MRVADPGREECIGSTCGGLTAAVAAVHNGVARPIYRDFNRLGFYLMLDLADNIEALQ